MKKYTCLARYTVELPDDYRDVVNYVGDAIETMEEVLFAEEYLELVENSLVELPTDGEVD